MVDTFLLDRQSEMCQYVVSFNCLLELLMFSQAAHGLCDLIKVIQGQNVKLYDIGTTVFQIYTE